MLTRSFLILMACALALHADGPSDNRPDSVRPVPPKGVTIPEQDRTALQNSLAQLVTEIAPLQSRAATSTWTRLCLPDVQIFANAVRYALEFDEFFDTTNEVSAARSFLQLGMERVAALQGGLAPWLNATGLVVRGYTSKIDGSVQPYGLVVPASFRPNSGQRYRLDAWFHGRDEKLTELNFLRGRLKSAGEFTPPDAFVLHLYGRYCNANKFAGEVDLLEALDAVGRLYPIDQNRIVVRGFSMGGAACWQFATHYADRWVAAAPGAGFSETADFLKVFQNEVVQPPWYEQKLWHWYDCTDYALNLFHCPTVAYSGEVDKQKQAADMMSRALEAEGIQLTHIIGPGTAHKYHPQAKEELNARIDRIVAKGRDPVPKTVRFTTWTLRYNRMFWVTLDGLNQHWERARIKAEIVDDHTIRAQSENVTALTLSMESGECPLDPTQRPQVVLDGATLTAPPVQSDRSWSAHFIRSGNEWSVLSSTNRPGLRKQHGLQGPIDDAFMDSFLMVHPTGQALTPQIGQWVAAEEKRAIEHWRRQFRGEARVKNDDAVTDEDIASHHLVLWGDPQSNRLLARIAAQLPIRWTQSGVQTGDAIYPNDRHALILISPNPLNPKRYVVCNSGFTFREYDYLNNARQVAKLPDYAVVDLSIPPNARAPGKIAIAGFFDEAWQLR